MMYEEILETMRAEADAAQDHFHSECLKCIEALDFEGYRKFSKCRDEYNKAALLIIEMEYA